MLLAPLPNSDSLSTNLAVTSSRKPFLTPSIIYLGIQPLSLLRCGLSNTGVGLAFIPLFPSVHPVCLLDYGVGDGGSLWPLIPSQPHRSARPLHSLSVLAFDQERLERKVGTHLVRLSGVELGEVFRPKQGPHSSLCTPQILTLRQARRPVPPDVAQQYQDIIQRSQWQRAQLEQGGPGIRRGRISRMVMWESRWGTTGYILTPFLPQSTWPSWSVSYSSTQRLPGAWAMTAAG